MFTWVQQAIECDYKIDMIITCVNKVCEFEIDLILILVTKTMHDNYTCLPGYDRRLYASPVVYATTFNPPVDLKKGL